MPADWKLFGLIHPAKRLTLAEGRKILERDQWRCQYCGLDGMASFENSLVMSVDFVVPRAKAGRKHLANLVTACRPCNLIKGQHVFKNLDEAKAFVLKRRAELHQEWEGRMGKLRAKSATA